MDENLRRCLSVLLDDRAPPVAKNAALQAYLDDWSSALGSVGFSRHAAAAMGLLALEDQIPQDRRASLGPTTPPCPRGVPDVNARPPGAPGPETAQRASALTTLPPGTPIVVALDGREEILFLLSVRRTRFIAEVPDGRKLSVPLECFLRVHDGPAPPRIPPEEAETRALIRALASRSPVGPALDLASRGSGILPLLLDELARAFDRIENARAGTRSPLGSAPGPVRKATSRDLALAKAIPLVICAVARTTGTDAARAIAERHPDARVLRAILPHLAGRRA